MIIIPSQMRVRTLLNFSPSVRLALIVMLKKSWQDCEIERRWHYTDIRIFIRNYSTSFGRFSIHEF